MKKCFCAYLFIMLFFSVNLHAEGNSLKELKNKAFDFYKNGQYEKAIQVTNEALVIAKEQFGPESLEAAEYLGSLGGLYRLQGNTGKGATLLKQAKAIREKRGEIGIPLGIQSEAFFDEVAKRLQGMTPDKDEDGMYSANVYPQNCDLDRDGDCDNDDKMIFSSSIGKCLTDAGYNTFADLDADGCVTAADEKYLSGENNIKK